MACLADLPEHRREALLWRFALELDYDGVDDLVAVGAGVACHVEGMDLRAVVAVLGDDGRHHLRNQQAGSAAEVLCGVEHRRRPGEFRHEQWCSFWSGGSGYRIQAPPKLDRDRAERGYHSRTLRWTVRLSETVIAAELLPPTGRCATRSSRTVWPAHVNLTSPRGRPRARLVAEFGSLCQACCRAPAFAIDHDHFTGRIRGLLCRNCNNLVDQCVHVSGCLWADYLNYPPAGHLRFTVPNRPLSRGDLARIDYLGFNPFPSPGGPTWTRIPGAASPTAPAPAPYAMPPNTLTIDRTTARHAELAEKHS